MSISMKYVLHNGRVLAYNKKTGITESSPTPVGSIIIVLENGKFVARVAGYEDVACMPSCCPFDAVMSLLLKFEGESHSDRINSVLGFMESCNKVGTEGSARSSCDEVLPDTTTPEDLFGEAPDANKTPTVHDLIAAANKVLGK